MCIRDRCVPLKCFECQDSNNILKLCVNKQTNKNFLKKLIFLMTTFSNRKKNAASLLKKKTYKKTGLLYNAIRTVMGSLMNHIKDLLNYSKFHVECLYKHDEQTT